jgi:imidazolonepropionase-like amidohydrolase
MMKFSTKVLGVLSAALVSVHLSTPVWAEQTLIQNVKVFNGQKMLSARSVLIEDKQIRDANFKGKVSAQMKIINGAGRTLLPGLIDAHVHAFKDQDLPLLYGVTTQIDMFSAVSILQEMNQRQRDGKNTHAADLISAGTLATAPNGHGTQFGMEIETLTSAKQAQSWVDKRIAEGSHFIKIVMESDGTGGHFDSLSPEIVQALITAAHQRNKKAVVHISKFEDAKLALEMGADGLVHLFTGRDIQAAHIQELIRAAKKNNAFVIPTFSVLESMAGIKSDDILKSESMLAYLNKEQIIPLKVTYGSKLQTDMLTVPKNVTKAFHDANLSVLAGTDAGNQGTQFGVSMHHELQSLVGAGLSPSAALQAATYGPARAFGLKDRGEIKTGARADLILVDGDPSVDITATRAIVEIWKEGVIVSPLREKKQQQVAQEKMQKATSTQQNLPPDGRISLFSVDAGKLIMKSPFGVGWVPSTDAQMGGKSQLNLSAGEVFSDGQQAIKVVAQVEKGFAYPWAGLAFLTSKTPPQAIDLSLAKTLQFKIKGDGHTVQVGFTQQGSFIPVVIDVKTSAEWQNVILSLGQFKGLDPSRVVMLSFNVGPTAGNYEFQLADVRLLQE